MPSRVVMLTIDVATDTDLAKAMEVVARAATGLIMDGLASRISTYDAEDEDPED